MEDIKRLVDEATVVKAEPFNHPVTGELLDDCWYFDFSLIENRPGWFRISVMGEHGATREEAKAKVLKRIEKGYKTGDYQAED